MSRRSIEGTPKRFFLLEPTRPEGYGEAIGLRPQCSDALESDMARETP
jgi:hypothetical protein